MVHAPDDAARPEARPAIREALLDLFPGQQFDEPLLRNRSKEVWGSTTSDVVVKVKKLKPGREPEGEYRDQSMLHDLLDWYDPTGSLRQRATIPRPLDSFSSERHQLHFLVMERLYPAEPGPFAALPRAYLGCRNRNHHITSPKAFARDTPDNYLSYGDIERIVSASPRLDDARTNIERLCHDLGVLLGLLHFGAQRDGRNTEVVVARRRPAAPAYTLGMIDFDKVQNLEALFARDEPEAIVRALHSRMRVEDYFPFPTSRGFRHFREGYTTCAERLDRERGERGYRHLAARVIDEHVTRWLKKKMVRLLEVEAACRVPAARALAYAAFVQDAANVEALQSFIADRSYHVNEEEIFGVAAADRAAPPH